MSSNRECRPRAWRRAAALAVMLIVATCYLPTHTEARSQRKGVDKATPENLDASFQAFCAEWMAKLRDRESYNIAHIQWETGADGALGHYIGYSEDRTCIVTAGPKPIGKINYREIRYEKRGNTVAAAQQSTPQPVEITDTRELFSFINGKWDY